MESTYKNFTSGSSTRNSSKGSVLIELALVLPIMLMLSLGMLSFTNYFQEAMFLRNIVHMASLTSRNYCIPVNAIDRQNCLDWLEKSLTDYGTARGRPITTHLAVYEKPSIVQKMAQNAGAFTPSDYDVTFFSTDANAKTAMDNLRVICTVEVRMTSSLYQKYGIGSKVMSLSALC